MANHALLRRGRNISTFSGLATNLNTILRLCQQRLVKRFSLLFAVGLGLSLMVAACSAPTSVAPNSTPTASQNRVVRIGHQKFDPFTLVKARGGLEERLKPLGVSVEWTEFQSGPPLLEALNAGSIDIGRTGDAPPVVAQAADAPLVYVGGGAAKPQSSGVVVPANSSIKTLADLRGKKVAFTKGSSANYLVVKAIESGGLKFSDIKPAYLSPADARSAFEQGNVDAWVIWDPFFAAVQKQKDVRVLVNGQGLAANRDFYLGSRSFAQKNADIIEAVREETQMVAQWADANPTEVVKILSPILGVEPAILDVVTKRRGYEFETMSDEMVAEQQEIADTFFKLKLIPKPVKVEEIVWKPS
ncbi:MAG: sulfonate ABC transporter substrate-binding protein [Symplocastrum torsivum CPER-KK1]|jgi:sulfonate transport system substrate-binding protein|uniref:Putative aliphatic sulfonates-binding protein n=1 Tax=Symplocastrum torsivum CPER-KK1 TaxID=450513 RepID=A0A951PR89_9CYAN|nr:sulfonate ABC transporter substrate-binding protein [Symplocastrum torsivum CPER-KK1]